MRLDQFFDRCPLFKILINNSHRICLHCHVRIHPNSMEFTSIGEFETLVNYFTDADQLMDFAATWEIQDSPAVLLRLYRLRNPDHDETLITEQILQTCDRTTRQQSANNMDLEYVRSEKEIEESFKALMFDDEMDEIATACIEDGNWNPLIQVHLFLFCQPYFDYLFDINETYMFKYSHSLFYIRPFCENRMVVIA